MGDERWAGIYGVSADYIALTHCAVEYISFDEIMVRISLDIGVREKMGRRLREWG